MSVKQKANGGFSLVEVVVAITVLAIVVVPVCSGMILSARMNAKAEATLQARIAVSSAVEILMAEGISGASDTYDVTGEGDRFPGVTVITAKENPQDPKPAYYIVTVFDGSDPDKSLVTVNTQLRAVETSPNGEGAGQ